MITYMQYTLIVLIIGIVIIVLMTLIFFTVIWTRKAPKGQSREIKFNIGYRTFFVNGEFKVEDSSNNKKNDNNAIQ